MKVCKNSPIRKATLRYPIWTEERFKSHCAAGRTKAMSPFWKPTARKARAQLASSW